MSDNAYKLAKFAVGIAAMIAILKMVLPAAPAKAAQPVSSFEGVIFIGGDLGTANFLTSATGDIWSCQFASAKGGVIPCYRQGRAAFQ